MAELIAPIADRKPDEPALVDEAGETTWASFDQRTNRLVSALRQLGLEPGDRVALMSGNRREAFEVTAAAMHGSWVVVPVNWHWVAEELAYVVNDSDARALVVDERFLDIATEALPSLGSCPVRIAMGGAPVEGFLSYEEVIDSGESSEPPDQGSGGPMFYTSGTTGLPEGGAGHAQPDRGPDLSMMQLVAGLVCGSFGIPADGVTLLEGPIYHSAQWVFSIGPMLNGGTVVMRHRFDPAETLELIDRYRVTNMHLVPTQFIRLLKLPDDVRDGFRRLIARVGDPRGRAVSRRGEAEDARVVGAGDHRVLRRDRGRLPEHHRAGGVAGETGQPRSRDLHGRADDREGRRNACGPG